MPVIRAPGRAIAARRCACRRLRVDVKIVGRLATTTWDMTVFNPQSRVLEGELVFPVGEGQTVSRFAMDVNGALREGVVVEKDKARQVFEEIVRRGIDPGLLEKTAGNSFRARVYPIPANGSKRVVIAYEQELPRTGKGACRGLLYHLPLAFTDRVDTFTMRVEVLDQKEMPRVQSSPLATFAFKSWQRAYVAEETQRDVVRGKALTFVVPRGEDDQGTFVAVDRGERYFYVTVSPRLGRQPKTLPKRAAHRVGRVRQRARPGSRKGAAAARRVHRAPREREPGARHLPERPGTDPARHVGGAAPAHRGRAARRRDHPGVARAFEGAGRRGVARLRRCRDARRRSAAASGLPARHDQYGSGCRARLASSDR